METPLPSYHGMVDFLTSGGEGVGIFSPRLTPGRRSLLSGLCPPEVLVLPPIALLVL